ncbi:MAG TPA: hypothetical protein VEC16_05190 [Alphaproteobacteria bacterium]|nr:hypothetical protein [Alphaproteobacteria bacterium]
MTRKLELIISKRAQTIRINQDIITRTGLPNYRELNWKGYHKLEVTYSNNNNMPQEISNGLINTLYDKIQKIITQHPEIIAQKKNSEVNRTHLEILIPKEKYELMIRN